MMKLRYSATSPFVRKVVITSIETGQDREIEQVPTDTTDPKSDHGRDNPLNKVPALVLDDGTAIYDSAVICEYLDHRKGGRLLAATGPARWTTLCRQALADGMMDAALLRRYESLRPESQRSPDWDARQKLKMEQGLDALEREAAGFRDLLDLGTIATATMLGYFDFRFKAEAWRNNRPNLTAWYAAFSKRPSFQSTLPPA